MSEMNQMPDYLFEVSWEVCNKIGGIHTVISTKTPTLAEELKDNLIMIGPDVWRDTNENPEFIEDNQLLSLWRNVANDEGLRVRVGRWNIPTKPIAIIVDFTHLIPQKNEIFKELWDEYGVDSLAGQWDYVEPALFGYAAGKVIESFTRHQLSSRHNVIAHFHEWMTGAGVLYIKKYIPSVGTVFTTHATVLGRSISGNGLPLYDNLKSYPGDSTAREINVLAKHSLEKNAAKHADAFTTVSPITASECEQFHERKVDFITPNGFDMGMVSDLDELKTRRVESRIQFIEVAEALLTHDVAKDALIVSTSGRYEMKNKGLDVFIDALAKLNQNSELKREVLAFILIPSNHHGPRKDVFKNLRDKDSDKVQVLSDTHLTHYLNDPEYDPILKQIKEAGLLNSSGDKVKIFFVPCYLNGNDGIFNRTYYDLLTGVDISVFPSYYEPWGYTPLESLAFRVPTITTSLTGFGVWVQEQMGNEAFSLTVVNRTDHNSSEVVDSIASTICEYSNLPTTRIEEYRDNASKVSSIAQWDQFIEQYYKAYSLALSKASKQQKPYPEHERLEPTMPLERKYRANQPNWVRLIIRKNIPEKLAPLDELSQNFWWCWNPDAVNLFETIDPDLWDACEYNPILFLDKISYTRFQELENDTQFLEKLNRVFKHYKSYMKEKIGRKGAKVAYFSMEFGLHTSLKIYSGGLGILAGDYLKEGSDRNVPITGIGLLYRYGYFTQQLTATGQQMSIYDQQNFTQTLAKPVRDMDGKWKTISIVLPGRNLYARIWRVDIGRTELYLLDTDFEENQIQDRSITHHLYGGDWENRLKQEILLGIGGVRALAELDITPDIYHLNEGHAAFAGLERLRALIMEEKLSFDESMELVRASNLFTTHTPVPAGHDSFPEDLLRGYMSHYPERLGITWNQFLALGRMYPSDENERFSMSHLAANLAQEVNGVSLLHGDVSRKMFAGLWAGYFPSELHLGHVTNGVHYPTWTSPEIRALIETEGQDAQSYDNHPDWEKIKEVPDDKLWAVKSGHRARLIDLIKKRLMNPNSLKFESPRNMVEIRENLRDDVLTIGFARRFATYKRAHLLMRDLDRLKSILNNPDMPVQFIFAGKAHPKDKAGQDLIKRIIEVSKQPDFTGKILFLQNYDMELARQMVQGVDIWLNTPTRPLEASGTSGMKAVMNGGLHFSVLDGWWVEGYKEGAGWALPMEKTYTDQEFQDELDAETIYTLLENEIVPMYYSRDSKDVPTEWVKCIKKSIAEVAPIFATTRMMEDYETRYYNKLYLRTARLREDDLELTRRIAHWKRQMHRNWAELEVISVEQFNLSRQAIEIGKEYYSEVVLDLGNLSPKDIGVELVVAELIEDNEVKIVRIQEFDLEHVEGNRATYKLSLIPIEPGAFESGIRIYAMNKELPHRMDFNLVRWV